MYNLLFSVSGISDAFVSAMKGAMGIGYTVLFNAIGVVSIFLQIMIFQMRIKKHIVLVGIFSSIGWLLYFALQGDFISCTSGIVGITSKIIILLSEKHKWAKSKWWNVGFVIFACVFSLLTFKQWRDIFALVAGMLAISAFFMKKENTIRKVFLFSYCAYICNSVSKLYWVSLIADVTALISVIVSLIRYRNQDKEDNKETETDGETHALEEREALAVAESEVPAVEETCNE